MDGKIEPERNVDDDLVMPGFRFHPTDEELVGFYLKRKVEHQPLPAELIKLVDIYKYEPWDLPKLTSLGEKEWYFYCPRYRKYKNSTRPNRVTEAGFWKATGTDRPIYSPSLGIRICIGFKKSLVFYKGRAAKCMKTEWMMHEFRLVSTQTITGKNVPSPDSLALCRIFKKAVRMANKVLSYQSEIHLSSESFSYRHESSISDLDFLNATTSTKIFDDHLSSSMFINPSPNPRNCGLVLQENEEIIEVDDEEESIEENSWEYLFDSNILWNSPHCP